MAIAFDATSYSQANGTSLTVSHTCTGSNRILITGYYNNSGSSDPVTAMTYAGVAMTKIVGSAGSSGIYRALYYLIAPATGANDLVVTTSGTVTSGLISASYTGVSQAGQPDASGTSIVDTSVTNPVSKSITTVADNCWIVGFYKNDSFQSTTTTGFTNRYAPAYTSERIGDSNAVKTPAGSYLMEITSSSTGAGQYHSLFMASIKPPAVYTMAAAVGAFTLTGIANVMRKGRTLTASAGSFALTGVAATFRRTIIMSAATGAFTLTGVSNLLKYARIMSAGVGSFILTGMSILFGARYTYDSKPTSSYTDDTKPTNSYSNDTKPSGSWTNDDEL